MIDGCPENPDELEQALSEDQDMGLFEQRHLGAVGLEPRSNLRRAAGAVFPVVSALSAASLLGLVTVLAVRRYIRGSAEPDGGGEQLLHGRARRHWEFDAELEPLGRDTALLAHTMR